MSIAVQFQPVEILLSGSKVAVLNSAALGVEAINLAWEPAVY
jgi:hypothetical protein